MSHHARTPVRAPQNVLLRQVVPACGWFLAAAAIVGFGVSRSANAVPLGYQLTWSDEFSGDSLDLNKWEYREPGPRRAAVNVPEAVNVQDGHLAITTWTEQTSDGPVHRTGMIGTQPHFQQTYGYYEARIDFNGAPGAWSAFWLQSPEVTDTSLDPEQAGVEIDIVEHLAHNAAGAFSGEGVQQNLHWGGYGLEHETTGRYTADFGAADGFHTYSVLWTPDSYRFFVDGVQTWNASDAPVSDRPQYLILSSEVDNGWAGAIPEGGFGSFADSDVQMNVDYVRVYQAPSLIPEPASLGLLAIGSLALLRRRR